MHTLHDTDSKIVHEISQMLIRLNPDAVLTSITEAGFSTTNSNAVCEKFNNRELITDEHFNAFVFSTLTETALKNDCHVAYFKCINAADKKFDACLKAANKNTDKIRKCLDQHASDFKSCIEKFEACKKKKHDDG